MAEMSDVLLLKMARTLARHDADIARVYADLKAQKAAVAKTRREVKATAFAAGTSNVGAFKVSKGGVQLGGLALRRGGFTLAGPALRGAAAVPIAVGAATAIVHLIKEFREFSQVREQWGTQEAIARVAKALPRRAMAAFAGAAIELSGEIYGDTQAAIEQRKRQYRAAMRRLPLFGESEAERMERMQREARIAAQAEATAQTFVDAQFTKPLKDNATQAAAFVRTSREAAAIRVRLDEENRLRRAEAYKNAQAAAMRALDPVD